MRYKLQLPNQTEIEFAYAEEGRSAAFEAGLRNVRLWISLDDKTWEELSQHGIQSVFAGE